MASRRERAPPEGAPTGGVGGDHVIERAGAKGQSCSYTSQGAQGAIGIGHCLGMALGVAVLVFVFLWDAATNRAVCLDSGGRLAASSNGFG